MKMIGGKYTNNKFQDNDFIHVEDDWTRINETIQFVKIGAMK